MNEGTVAFLQSEAEERLKALHGWTLSEDAKKISKEFTFKNFLDAMRFANNVAHIAEAEGHHPDLHIKWGNVSVETSTHSIGGLSENDFILAAKIDEIAH